MEPFPEWNFCYTTVAAVDLQKTILDEAERGDFGATACRTVLLVVAQTGLEALQHYRTAIWGLRLRRFLGRELHRGFYCGRQGGGKGAEGRARQSGPALSFLPCGIDNPDHR